MGKIGSQSSLRRPGRCEVRFPVAPFEIIVICESGATCDVYGMDWGHAFTLLRAQVRMAMFQPFPF